MPVFRRRDAVIDAERGEGSTADSDRAADARQARLLVDEAEAEAAEADAKAAAARARARAARLRRQALDADARAKQTAIEAVQPEAADVTNGDTAGDKPEAADFEFGEAQDTDAVDIDDEHGPRKARSPRNPRRGWKAVVATLAVLLTAAFLTVSGLMLWKHHGVEKVRQQDAEYSAAARQCVVTLMSLDFTKAKDEVQRIIDNSTGQFKTDFESHAADFIKVAQDSKVVTEVSVNSTAVDSMSDDAAQVLVAASSRVTNSAGAKQEPRTWRLSVSLKRENGQIKMEKVDFVP